MNFMGANAEEDFCYVRFEEGSWYTIYVPTTFTNGMASTIYSEMASSLMSDTTPLQISLDGTTFDERKVKFKFRLTVQEIWLQATPHLFMATTIDNVEYTGYNGIQSRKMYFLGG